MDIQRDRDLRAQQRAQVLNNLFRNPSGIAANAARVELDGPVETAQLNGFFPTRARSCGLTAGGGLGATGRGERSG